MGRNHRRCLRAQAAECVRGLRRSWHSGPTRTDSTPLLTDTTDKLRSERTRTQGTGAENLLMHATRIHTGTNDGNKVHIPLDSPAGRLLTPVTLCSSSARDARKENSCHFVLKHAGSFQCSKPSVQKHVILTQLEVHVTGFAGATS